MEEWWVELDLSITAVVHKSDEEEEEFIIEWLIHELKGCNNNDERRQYGGSMMG